MTTVKPLQQLMTALIVAVLSGVVGAIGFEIMLEFDRWDVVPRTYKAGLWASDTALVVGISLASYFGYWGWKDSQTFKDLFFIDFVDWARGCFKG